MKTNWALFVKIIHLLFVLYVIIAPFSGKCEVITMHAIIVPFLFLHWLTNNDTCALTEIEKFLCNKNDNEETFIGSIVSPVYKVDSNDIKILTLLLWVFSLSQTLQCSKVLSSKLSSSLRVIWPKTFAI